MKKIILAVLFVVSTINCLQANQGVSQSKTISVDGILRKYRIYVPLIYDGSVSVPLVFNFHGKTSSAREQERYGDFRKIADTANFIIIHPQGMPNNTGENTWNVNDSEFNTSDVNFISALIDNIEAQYNINSSKIYLAGLSFGGTMSYKLACVLSDRITAVACVSGAMNYKQIQGCNPSHFLPVLQIHGTADPIIPFNGNVNFLSMEKIVNHWSKINSCDSVNADIETITNSVATDASTAQKFSYKNGMDGLVELYKVIGGGHSWPGSKFYIDVTNQDFSASVVIWDFFRKYDLDSLTVLNTNAGMRNSGEDTEQQSLSIKDKSVSANEQAIITSPNPFVNEFSLQLQNFASTSEITVTNLLGQIVDLQFNTSTKNNFTINTSQWIKGVYTISVNDGGIISHKKIIKK
jgi:polyhydroxybutyrate depolymerase